MHREHPRLAVVAFTLLGAFIQFSSASATTSSNQRLDVPDTSIVQSDIPVADGKDAVIQLGRMPISFTEACTADRSYHARGLGYHIRLQGDEARLGFIRTQREREGGQLVHALDIVNVRFAGASSKVAASGSSPAPGRSHYIRGGSDNCLDRAHFGKVRFASIYPGIDIVYYGSGEALEFDFELHPGADPSVIRMKIDGADQASVDASGNLDIRKRGHTLVLRRPVAYQIRDGQRVEVTTDFAMQANGEVALNVGAYDRSEALTIDPVLTYATYLGGTKTDYGIAVAAEELYTGVAVVVGYTTSTDFRMLSAYDKVLGTGDVDAFVTKINTTGKTLIYSTFLGATGIDRGVGVAVDSTGAAYVAGTTTGGFPTTAGAYQTTASGGSDSFVIKLTTAGALVYSTYLRGVGGTRDCDRSERQRLCDG